MNPFSGYYNEVSVEIEKLLNEGKKAREIMNLLNERGMKTIGGQPYSMVSMQNRIATIKKNRGDCLKIKKKPELQMMNLEALETEEAPSKALLVIAEPKQIAQLMKEFLQ